MTQRTKQQNSAAEATLKTEDPDLKSANARQEQEIEDLKAENLAARAENSGLREAARADRTQIEDLTRAQRQIETLNRDLELRNRTLMELNKELESFSYAVSHDLRSPLRSIHGFSDALRQSAAPKLTADELVWLQKISDAAARMDRLTEDLLRLSRITRSQLRREPLDLGLLAREVVQDLRQGEPHRDAIFAISDDLRVVADAALMRIVISNLIENAWKYTGRKSQALIAFGKEVRGEQVIFCVRDNGAGFDMTYASKLFTPFQRLHSTREFPGSGVGLACAARVIHKHGGRIWADGKPDEGAAFFFTIPEKSDSPEESTSRP